MRALIVCPGRGSYGRALLGTLRADGRGDDSAGEILNWLDDYRRGLGRPTLRTLDADVRFSPRRHMAGEHASLMTFGYTLADYACLAPESVRPVAVTGNSMGWYTALAVSGVLPLDEGARLVETMGAVQADNVIGGQVLYPICGEDWRPDPDLETTIQGALALDGVYLSIRLGGTAILGAADPRALLKALPKLTRGRREYPIQLPLHSAFHTPLLAETGAWAREALADLRLQTPVVPLVGGDGRCWRRWADLEAMFGYTLGTQVETPYDFTAALTAALGDYAPESVICLGPGDTMGAPVAQAMIRTGWHGLRDRTDFLEAQAAPTPLVISMARPAQRALVV